MTAYPDFSQDVSKPPVISVHPDSSTQWPNVAESKVAECSERSEERIEATDININITK